MRPMKKSEWHWEYRKFLQERMYLQDLLIAEKLLEKVFWRITEMFRSIEKYYLTTADGKRVAVSEEVYREYRKSERHEKYLLERDRKKKLQSLDQMAESSIFGDCGVYDDFMQVEAIVLRGIYTELLNEYLKAITHEQRRFLSLLYEDRMTVAAASKKMGWSRRKGQYWKRKLLLRLREYFRRDGITDYSF